ncbi:MAG: efflux RND transporter periplasmic adaptor subunit [Caldilineaceae bacterium]
MKLIISRKLATPLLISMIGLLLVTTGIAPLFAAPAQLPTLQGTIPSDEPPSGIGRVELEEKYQVVLMVGGIVDKVNVEVGDQVKKGDLLIALNTQELDWAVQQAEMDLESSRLSLAKLNETVEQTDVAKAEANYLLAKENYAVVEAGPTEDELNAAKNSAAAAWASYNELKAGPTEDQLTQLRADIRKAEINLQEAQRAYDKIAWMPEAGTRPESAALQQATISYESTKASYDEAVSPAKESSLQSALASAQKAQVAVAELEKKPTAAELASAKADLASAEATLAEMKKGPNQNDLRLAEISVEKSLIGLEQARLDLENAKLMAPVGGTVLAVNVEAGERASAGSVVVTLADTNSLKLMVNVEQKNIPYVQIGQEAKVSVYALPDHTFSGIVDLIVPVSDDSSGQVTYPVTLHFTDESLAGLLPGMTATAIFSPTASTAAVASQ